MYGSGGMCKYDSFYPCDFGCDNTKCEFLVEEETETKEEIEEE